MLSYEIRILKEETRHSAIIEASHLDDHAAIRSARKLAGEHGVEVWRGLDCIYRLPAEGNDRAA